MATNTYMNVYASMMNIVKLFRDNHPDYDFELMDFDMNVANPEYPSKNLLGIYQLEYEESDGLINASCVFPISILANDNPLALGIATGLFVNEVRVQTAHPLYDYESNQIVGLLRAKNSLAVSPVTSSQNRQFHFILQQFGSDQAVTGP